MDKTKGHRARLHQSAESRFHAGVALMRAPDSDANLQHAISLVESAADGGFAPATEMCAVFEAMGVRRTPNWTRALDVLQRAAEQGSASAQGQLLLLSDRFAFPDVRGDEPAAYWGEIRRAIDLDALLEVGERISLSDVPRIRVLRGFASLAECRWLVERAQDRLQPALIFDRRGQHVIDPGRSNTATEFQVVDMDLVLEAIRERISRATRVPLPLFELSQIFHYSVGEEFRPHHDYLDPANPEHQAQLSSHGQRMATFLIYLNEAFEGGETDFPAAGIRFRGQTGDAIFWANVDMNGAPDGRSIHWGRPPSSGEKWILSQWIRDRAPAQDCRPDCISA